MRDYITCHGCGMVIDSDLAFLHNDNWYCSKKCAFGLKPSFPKLNELQRTQMNDRRAAQKEIDRDFQDFGREHT